MNIKFKYSTSTPINLEYPVGTKISCVLGNANVSTFLGFDASSVNAVVNGIPAGSDTVLTEGDTVTFVTKAHEKAVA